MTEAFQVRHKTSAITVYPWRHASGRTWWRYKRQDGKLVTRADVEDAKEQAKIHAAEVHRGSLDLSTLDPEQVQRIKRMLERDPRRAHVDEFCVGLDNRLPR